MSSQSKITKDSLKELNLMFSNSTRDQCSRNLADIDTKGLERSKSHNSNLTRCSSAYANSSLDFTKDTITIDSVEIPYGKEVNFDWIANQCSSLGRIGTIQEYYKLLNGEYEEDCQSIVLTLSTLREINTKLNQFENCIKGVTNFCLDWPEQVRIDQPGILSEMEIKKTVFLSILTSFMEQPSRIYMLYYLLNASVRERDFEDFEVVAQFLAYLTESRRFTDAFIAIVEELTLFGGIKPNHSKTGEKDEIESLFEILTLRFFDEDVRKQFKAQYLKFLCNCFWRSRKCYSDKFNEHRSTIVKLIISSIDWCHASKSITNIPSHSIKQKDDQNSIGHNNIVKLVNIIMTSKAGEAFYSLIKCYQSSISFTDVLSEHNVVCLLCKIIESSAYTSDESIEIDSNEVEQILKTLYCYEIERLNQLDEIFCSIQFKHEHQIDSTLGFSIIVEEQENNSFIDYAIFSPENYEDIDQNMEGFSQAAKVKQTCCTKEMSFDTSIPSFAGYKHSRMSKARRSTVISSMNRNVREHNKRKFFNPFAGLKKLCCLK